MSPRGKGEGALYFKASKGLWVGRIELPTLDGERRRKEFSAKTKTEALAKRRTLLAQLEHAGDLPTATMTVAQWFEYWLREVATKSRRPKTIGSYRSMIDKWIIPTIGKTRLDKLSPVSVRKVFHAMETAGLSSTYMRNAHSVMSAAFADAHREGRIPRNPVDIVTAPRKSVTHLDQFTPDEAADLIRAFGEEPEAYMWATFLLTGARRGEVLGLEWDRVGTELDLSWQLQRLDDRPRPADFEYRQIEGGLYWTRPKTKRGWRIIPLVDPLKSMLEAWREQSPENPWGLVFTRQTKAHGRLPWDPDYASRYWSQMSKQLGTDKNVRLHDLRHSTAGMLYAAGIPEDIIEAILGHSTAAMSRHYRGRVDPKRLEAAMKTLTTSLDR